MNINFDIKIVAIIISLLVTATAVTGGYYVMKSDVNNLKIIVEKQNQRIHDLEINSTVDNTTLGNVEKKLEEVANDVKELLKR